MSWLVTGAAGFVGFHLCRRLAADGHAVVAFDSFDETYEPGLKKARADRLLGLAGLRFVEGDVRDPAALERVFTQSSISTVAHLAARTGVRGSHSDPIGYVEANVVGTTQVLERAVRAGADHVVYASSSSVYGERSLTPFSVDQPADHPVSLYAASKRATELLAHSYATVHGLPTTGLRFFTVYGPWGRPDMAYFAFADAILAGEPITVYGDGSAVRDFTYVDDVIEGLVRVAADPPLAGRDPGGRLGSSSAPWRLFNIGFGSQAAVNDLIALLEERIGHRAVRVRGDLQPGDVTRTQADTIDLAETIGYTPKVPLEEGLARFVEWLRAFRAGSA
ncbi:MAG: NAD-dependent epimerase/dehydratase family protein [Actinomycetota bacterium]|nr:NAD-dependent epimerase/dehydratase family protein [Actinomycetota bacterium]